MIMNPKSGDGKAEKFGLKRKAEDLGAEVSLIGAPEPVDVAKVAREAVKAGADLLGVVGVTVASDRPGIPAPKPPKDWARLRYLAGIPKTAPRSPH
jgi:hypothetical protein